MPAIESQKNDGNSEVGRDECRSFLRSDLSKLSTTSRSLVDDKDKTTRISLKILLSKNVAGSIIGKSGDAIARAQRNSLCRIKLSQSCSFFPGTTDRVCLLQGEQKQHVNDAVHAVLEKMREVKVSTPFVLRT